MGLLPPIFDNSFTSTAEANRRLVNGWAFAGYGIGAAGFSVAAMTVLNSLYFWIFG